MSPQIKDEDRGRQGPQRPARKVRQPRPRAELLDLTPLDRVLAQLDALGLDYQETDPGYAARCPSPHQRPRPAELRGRRTRPRPARPEREPAAGRDGPAALPRLRRPDRAGRLHPGQRHRRPGALALRPVPGRGDRPPGRPPGRPTFATTRPPSPSRPPLTDDEIDGWEEKAEAFEAALAAGGGGWLDELAVPARRPGLGPGPLPRRLALPGPPPGRRGPGGRPVLDDPRAGRPRPGHGDQPAVRGRRQAGHVRRPPGPLRPRRLAGHARPGLLPRGVLGRRRAGRRRRLRHRPPQRRRRRPGSWSSCSGTTRVRSSSWARTTRNGSRGTARSSSAAPATTAPSRRAHRLRQALRRRDITA